MPNLLMILLHTGVTMNTTNIPDQHSIEITFQKGENQHRFCIDSVSLSLYKDEIEVLIHEELSMFLQRVTIEGR